MRSVMFNFRPEVSRDEQDAALERISGWQAISKASRLKPDTQKPVLQRMAYAYVEDDADIEKIVERLNALTEIESASAPTLRHLIR